MFSFSEKYAISFLSFLSFFVILEFFNVLSEVRFQKSLSEGRLIRASRVELDRSG